MKVKLLLVINPYLILKRINPQFNFVYFKNSKKYLLLLYFIFHLPIIQHKLSSLVNPTPVRGGVYHPSAEKWQLLLKIMILLSQNFVTFPIHPWQTLSYPFWGSKGVSEAFLLLAVPISGSWNLFFWLFLTKN